MKVESTELENDTAYFWVMIFLINNFIFCFLTYIYNRFYFCPHFDAVYDLLQSGQPPLAASASPFL